MGPLHQRAPGIIGAALDPRVPLTPTLIGDLVHVHEALVAMVFAAGRPILVSDAVATGVPYFDAAVTAESGAAYLPDGTLTGAVSLLDDAVRNVVGLGTSHTSAIVAASVRPAAVLGIPAPPGTVELDAGLHGGRRPSQRRDRLPSGVVSPCPVVTVFVADRRRR